ncbi:MAG: hypothetical protein AVDCRST_MAG16-1293 [uncultured Frankineae bacterium]|uniref:Uncharacterized protein n=1 Tax=uncultured Frankineae bacterium TaxID=437475 RepID=A0A6J4LGD4_9ACTN|nr:MAG: hypothetical protein AVDCRST_MAG16-1293 [uncultured Frankineae bacterium]
MLRETSQFYIALDESGVVRGWNRAASRLFGFSSAQAVGTLLEDLIVPPAYRSAHRRGIDDYVRTGHGRGVDAPVVVRAVRSDGSQVPVELTIWAQRTDTGYLFHALGSDLTERRAHEHVLRVLAEHRRALLHLDRPEDVHRLLVDTAPRATRCDGAWLYVPDGPQPSAALRAVATAFGPDGQGLTDLGEDGPDPDAVRSRLSRGLGTLATEPVVMGEGLVGLLAVGWLRPQGPLSATTMDLLAMLAAEAGLVVQRLEVSARLAAAAHTDSLTGLANRRTFDDTLTRELSRATREDGQLALVLLDLDHFKSYNDAHGHPAGDDLLRRITAAWHDAVRAPDLLARIGGDEFALLLPTTGLAAAEAAVARLRALSPDGVQFSAGTATRSTGDDARMLLQRADSALYQRKRDRPRGRDG